jgi:hypothetical protein
MLWANAIWRSYLNYTDDRGYIIPAFNTQQVNYVECARTLAKSLRYQHPHVKICLLTSENIDDPLFDYVQVVEDLGGYKNDWQVYANSPFHETVKLEADMILTGPFEHWWTMFRHYDVYVSTGCKNFQDEDSHSKRYRKIFDTNQLPDVYNAITYWRVSSLAQKFFTTIKNLMNNWSSVQNSLVYGKCEPLNTDLAYAIAIAFMGEEFFTSPGGPKITHMKPAINGLTAEDWSKQLVWEIISGQVRLNGFSQNGFLHYHKKELARDLGQYYD